MKTPTPKTPIITQRLLLRAAQASDLSSLHQLYSDEEVMKYWSCAPYTTINQTSATLHETIATPTEGHLNYAIELVSPSASASEGADTLTESEDRVIGRVGIWDPLNSEIGFMLHRDYWGKGYMGEALSALLGAEGVFWGRGVERVVADVDPRNEGSLRLLGRFGFVETGRGERTFETQLGWCDSVYLELRRPLAEGGVGGRCC